MCSRPWWRGCSSPSAGWTHFWIAWQRRLFAAACGAVIIAAPIVYLVEGGLATIRRAPRQLVELLALTAGLIVALLAPFGWEPARLHYQWLMFAPLPLLLWAAVRFGPGGLGLHLLAVALVTLLATRAGRGPFVAGSPAQVVLALQGFFFAISIPLMLLAALVRQHARAAASLRQSQAQYRSVVEDQSELICRFTRRRHLHVRERAPIAGISSVLSRRAHRPDVVAVHSRARAGAGVRARSRPSRPIVR